MDGMDNIAPKSSNAKFFHSSNVCNSGVPEDQTSSRRMRHSPDVSSSTFATQASPRTKRITIDWVRIRTGNPQYSGSHSNQYDGFVMTLIMIFRVYIWTEWIFLEIPLFKNSFPEWIVTEWIFLQKVIKRNRSVRYERFFTGNQWHTHASRVGRGCAGWAGRD